MRRSGPPTLAAVAASAWVEEVAEVARCAVGVALQARPG